MNQSETKNIDFKGKICFIITFMEINQSETKNIDFKGKICFLKYYI